MREQSVVAERDAEAGCSQQPCGNRKMKPISAAVPQVQWHRGQCQKKCANQERACRPINPVARDSENQGGWEVRVGSRCRYQILRTCRAAAWREDGRLLIPTLITYHWSLGTSGKWATENHVFFCPGMNAAAMQTGELLRFHFGGRPELFFHGASGIGQL